MKEILILVFCILSLWNTPLLAQSKVYPLRWFYVSRNLASDRDVEEIRGLVRTAAEHGLNGMLFSAGLDRLDLQTPDYLRRLEQVRQICERNNVEIIPSIFSAGYGGSILAYNKNLAAALAVKDALFVVRHGAATLVADPTVQIANGGFETHDGDRLAGYQVQDRPGESTFVDTKVYREGKSSLRLENFGKSPGGQVRVMQEVAVHPRRAYRVKFWMKTEGLQLGPEGTVRVLILGPDGRRMRPWEPRPAATAGWREFTLGFNSLGYDKVQISAGVWDGKTGKAWIDGLRIEEVGLVDVLRRPETPVTVRGDSSGAVYQEGRDYAPIADPNLNFLFDHDAPPIRILPGGRIKDGERLRVNYYHGTTIYENQVPICMSEPQVYEIWRTQARLMNERLRPKRYVLSMDEIRVGGACEACQRRKMTMAQILGDTITRQYKMLRETNPKADVWIWSDMLDPNHNARPNYYLVEGDYTGSWNYVPKGIGIVCWYYEKRSQSLAHFSRLGFRTLAGAYYDADTLENPKGWLEALDRTPNAVGIMYTSWRNKYALLAAFGDLVMRKR